MMVTRVAAALFAFLPFAFALMRAVETEGRDLRYLWVAPAALAGAMIRMALAAGVFVVSTLCAAAAAWALGTTVGSAMFIVAAGFGFCFAASTFLRLAARA